MQTVYHITPTKNLKSIQTHGLIPQLGSNAQACHETKPAIWVFTTQTDVNNALMNWLDDLYDDNELLSELVIKVPNNLIQDSDIEYEKIIRKRISPKYITKIIPQ